MWNGKDNTSNGFVFASLSESEKEEIYKKSFEQMKSIILDEDKLDLMIKSQSDMKSETSEDSNL